MKALLQRVHSASVEISGEQVGSIATGVLVFLGIEKNDTQHTALKMLGKILKFRIFEQDGKMNASVQDVGGGVLLVSQFTLAADTKSGTRAGFSTAMPPQDAEKLYNYFLENLTSQHSQVASGVFGADMQVSLVNDGPVSFILEVAND
jgi:D-tyrosyl-tRNA(Tyr) deacylase